MNRYYKPDCFQSMAQWEEYVFLWDQSEKIEDRRKVNACLDCNKNYQKEMTEKGRCEFPNFKIPTPRLRDLCGRYKTLYDDVNIDGSQDEALASTYGLSIERIQEIRENIQNGPEIARSKADIKNESRREKRLQMRLTKS